MARRARELGKRVMVGNMCGTSLAAAPAFVLGQFCDVVDLDCPIFLAADRTPSVRYEDGTISCGDAVWGAKAASCTPGPRKPGLARRAGWHSGSGPRAGD